jgi:hypothetical protein
MVAIDAMADSSGIVESRILQEWETGAAGESADGAERIVDQVAQAVDGEGATPRAENGFGGSEAETGGGEAVKAAAKLLDMTGREFVEFAGLVASGRIKEAAKAAGMMPHRIANANSPIRRILSATAGMTAVQWDVLRHIAKGERQSGVASLTGTSKQAVNIHARRLADRFEWCRELVWPSGHAGRKHPIAPAEG